MKHRNEKTILVAGEHLRGLIQVNIAVLLFSGTALFAKVIPLPVPYIIFGRSVVAATVLFAYARLTDAAIRPDNRRSLSVLLGAGVLLGLHWLTYFQAIRVSTVAVGTIALHTYPIIATLLPLYAAVTAIVFLGEIPTVQTIVGGGVVIGAVMIETVRAANAVHPINEEAR